MPSGSRAHERAGALASTPIREIGEVGTEIGDRGHCMLIPITLSQANKWLPCRYVQKSLPWALFFQQAFVTRRRELKQQNAMLNELSPSFVVASSISCQLH